MSRLQLIGLAIIAVVGAMALIRSNTLLAVVALAFVVGFVLRQLGL